MTWPVVLLGEVTETALGKMLDRGKPKAHPLVPYLRNVNVQWGRIDTDDLLTMELAEDEHERFAVKAGDLLVCEGGEIGRAAIWHGRTEYLAYQKALHRIRPSDRLDAKFLRYLLEHHALTGALAKLSTGTTIAHLPQQQLRRVPVPLPPIAEQRRIVDLLEDHLSRLDAADAYLDAARRRLQSLRDSSLTEALRVAFSAPSSHTSTLGELARISSGMTPLKANKAFYEGGTIPWVTSGDLHKGLISQASHHVTETALAETTLKVVPAGTLLVAMYGEGKTRGTAAELAIDAATNQACAAIQLHDQDLRPWVRLVLDANYMTMRRMAAGGVQPNLNLTIIKSIPIPIPTPELRQRALDEREGLSDANTMLSAQIQRGQRRTSALRRALLGAAFSGRLTESTEMSEVEEMMAT